MPLAVAVAVRVSSRATALRLAAPHANSRGGADHRPRLLRDQVGDAILDLRELRAGLVLRTGLDDLAFATVRGRSRVGHARGGCKTCAAIAQEFRRMQRSTRATLSPH
jgi:hypothetical protein